MGTYDYSCLEQVDVLNATCLTGGTHVTPTNHCHPAKRTPPDTNGVRRTGQWSQTNRPMECLAESKEGPVCVARACYRRATVPAGRTAVVYWLNAAVLLTTTTLYQHGSRRHVPTNMHGMHAAAAASPPPPRWKRHHCIAPLASRAGVTSAASWGKPFSLITARRVEATQGFHRFL